MYKYLKYFLECYWNQMAEDGPMGLIYSVDDFNKESDEYIVGLKHDLDKASRFNIIIDSPHDKLYHVFWKDFDRVINYADMVTIVARLR